MFRVEEDTRNGTAAGVDDAPASLDELPLEHLEHEICQLAAHINAGTCRMLELIAEFDRREAWAEQGCGSCAEWVAWRCSLNARAAREYVRVARRLEELAGIHAAFSCGRLSYSKVRALTRVATEESEPELLELAEHATAAQLERIVRGLRHVANAEAAQIQANRHLSLWWEDDGSLTIHGNLPPEDGAILEAALDAVHDRLYEAAGGDGGSAEPPSAHGSAGSSASPNGFTRRLRPLDHGSAEPFEPRTATNADAIVAMADAALSAPDRERGQPSPSGVRHEIVVHVDAATLSADAPGRCRVAGGSALAAETARRLACEGSVVPVIEAQGSTLSVGRKTRKVPPALERAVRNRDGGCRFPGCENRRFGEIHHIVHWARGGETSLENLVWLCRRHHRLLHEGDFSAERASSGELVFRDKFGAAVAQSPDLPSGSSARLAAVLRSPGSRAAPAEAPTSGTGERLDLDHALFVLATRPWAAARNRARSP